MARVFIDTNVLIYAFTDDPRCGIAETLLAQGFDISVQVLNEFANVARRKLSFDWSQVEEALAAIGTLARTIHPVDLITHKNAMALAPRYRFAIYDALIVSAALKARCEILYSEDMQHDLLVEGQLRIVNPFGISLTTP